LFHLSLSSHIIVAARVETYRGKNQSPLGIRYTLMIKIKVNMKILRMDYILQ